MTVDPAGLSLVRYPSPILRQRAEPVPQVNDEVRAVADRMIQIMREAEGIGLAAPQVGLPWRMFVVDLPEGDDRSLSDVPPTATPGPVVYINPELSEPQGAPEPLAEGCLSLPEITGDVLRSPQIRIRATDTDGQTFEQEGRALLARVWQHENDHLDGVLIIDRMTQLSRLKNRSAIRSLERTGASA